ncbi:protein SOB FIVE-LIKE 5-like [Rhodamnia argentea]|uniref:Protein SOB FIVE-LIKE 5-like n=1 Tax=Rhodamnia argentea TaxID=178133 RepID=A0A8B8NJW2_9MYRT|nr:protein SOB FIVE-LIKE 5-like [Rhodamnia argentea]
MNVLVSSECSSGCESGWTLYFEHSVNPSRRDPTSPFLDERDDDDDNELCDEKRGKGIEDDEEEGLSMVSDASSGPPVHFLEDVGDQQGHFNNGSDHDRCVRPTVKAPKKSGKRQRTREQQRPRHYKMNQDSPSLLDDTATSPIINFFPTNDLILSERPGSMESVLEFSEGRPAFHDRFGFMQPPHSGKQNDQWFGRNGMQLR